MTGIVCDGCHAPVDELAASGHRGNCAIRGRHLAAGCALDRPWPACCESLPATGAIAEREQQRSAQYSRRRASRGEQRLQLATARAAGLTRRHEAKLRRQP